MEAAKYNPPTQSLSEGIMLSDDTKGILSSNVNFSLTDLPGMTQNLNNRDEINKDISEHTNRDIVDINASETTINSAIKSMSPTIIEHAFNVMKNLFSPDKSKSKPTGVANIIINPVKPQQNSPEASSASVLVQTNSVHSTESIGVDIVDDVVQVCTPDSQILKNEMNHLGTMLSPIVQDVHNNTDDSFLTTVSLIDESFQSAITHIDGNGEGVKLGSNPVENLLNDSRDLDLSDICNDSLEGNDHSLENTLLKNGSLDHLDNESNGSREGNLENLNSTQIPNCHDKDQDAKMAEVPDVATTQVSEPLKENPVSVNGNSEVHSENHSDLGNVEKIVEVLKDVAMEEQKSVDTLPTPSSNESQPVEPCQNVHMENLFLNRHFEKTQSESESSKPIPLMINGNIEGSPRGGVGEVQEELRVEDKVKTEAISQVSPRDESVKTNISVVDNGKKVQVDLSISTTTVVLARKECDDLEDNDRLSLTDDDIEENISSSSSSPSAKSAVPFEAKNKPPEILCSSPPRGQKSTPVKNMKNETKKSGIKSTGKKVSKSEGSSPNKSPKTKNKLNKSADESNSSRLHDSPKQKSKEGETPSKGKDSLGKDQHLTSSSLNQTKEVSEGNSREEPETTNEVLSQESYTILNAPKSLERPVIESSKEGFSEESKTPCDLLIDRSKQSTPMCEKPKLEVSKPEELEVKSPVARGSPELKPTSAVNEEPTEFSPVTPIMDHTFAFESSSEREGANGSQSQSTKLNSTWVTSSKPTNEMNRTYDKKPETPKILNQTYDKSADAVTMNKTFDKEPVSKFKPQPEMNKTFDKDQNPVQLVSVQATIKDKSSDASTIQVSLTNMTIDNSNGISGTNPKRPSHDGDSTVTVGSEVHNLSDLAGKFNAMNLKEESSPNNVVPLEDQLDSSFKLQYDPDLVQLIQEQFTSTDIEKICSVVDDISSMKLSSQIMKASEQFDKSFHESIAEIKTPVTETKSGKPVVNPLSPQSFDFLNSITGKPTGRDLSRESLYVKFDPLVQAPNANSLIDFTKEAEILPTIEASPEIGETGTNFCEQLLAISPQKKPDDIVPPLTPLSHRNKTNAKEDKFEKLKELQNEIFFLKNLYAEREKANKGKMEDYENRVAKLTGENCVLEEKLKDSSEREKSLVRKLNEQSQNLEQLKVIMNEYIKVIAKLTEELETTRRENAKQIENLTSEKDSYLTHLQNTEAAFTDVHTKYEKSKKTILSLKTNEGLYKATLAEQATKLEEFKEKAREAQEKATTEFQKFQLELEELKGNHAQETTRLRAQLRKTELKLEAMQESLDQKIKENEQLTAICDDLIEGKK